MTSASSIRRRIAGASILVAAVAGCAGTPSAFAGSTPSLKAVAPPGALDTATIKRLNELEQAGVLKCLGTVKDGVDQAACTPTQPGSPVGPVGGGPATSGGFVHQGGGVIDMDALGCKGQQGPLRPGEAAMDADFDGVSTEELRRQSQEARASAQAFLRWAEQIEKAAAPKQDRASRGDRAAAVEAFRDRLFAEGLREGVQRENQTADKIDHEIRRREQAERNAPNSSPNARRPVPRPGSSLPKPDDVTGGPSALACATMEKARSKTPEELKQANTPVLQNVCADPAKQDGEQQTGLQVDCRAAAPKANDCATEPTPTCVERTSPLANVRKIPGLTMKVPGVVVGCAGRKDADCG